MSGASLCTQCAADTCVHVTQCVIDLRAELAAEKERHQATARALERTLGEWVRMANSGDAGFWDPEKEEHVIAARAALDAVKR